MKAMSMVLSVSVLGVLIAPLRRLRSRRQAPARMDAAAYAALLAEADRIATPYTDHVRSQLASLAIPSVEEFGGDFPEVDALLERAGILV